MSDKTKPDELPATKDETTDLLDAATDFLVDSAIPVPFWKNVAKALRQLSTAAIEWPAAYFEGKAAEKRAETKARVKIIEENTDQITGKMEVPSEYAQKAVKKYGEKILREQSNLDKICAIAIKLLKKEKSTSSTNQSTDSGEEKTINDDWLNNFEEEARQKSTEDMQLRFGRILAGEIRNPGAYSIKAVKILGELTPWAAQSFKWLCSRCVVWGDPAAGFLYDARVPSLGGNANRNTLAGHGITFDDLNILNEHGLIISEYHSSHTYNWSILGEVSPRPMPFWYQGRYWALFPLEGWDKNQEQFRLWGIALSQVGRELFRVADQDPAPRFTEDLKKFFVKQHLRMDEVDKSDDPWKELPTDTSGSVE